ncbi:MAG TPA: phosphoribosylamine--glycine ligase [Acidimicrobiia bacterium]
MRVLLIGGGGREHAIGWKLAASPRVREIYSLPGNPGLAALGPIIEGITPTDAGAVAAMARIHGFDLVVVGPEAPLAAGVIDAIARLGIPVFGPTRAAARLETSKTFAKQAMNRAGVPTGWSMTFEDSTAAAAHIDATDGPYVVKADGLAGGKGVLVAEDRVEAKKWVERWIGEGPVVVEEFLQGPEVSVIAVCTASGAQPMAPARDYKRLLDGDQGPNTGGMGAYSPVDLEDGLADEVVHTVIEPILDDMATNGTPYHGFLYAGLVLTADGPKVLEFNARLGDPEAEVILPRLANDLIDVLEGTAPVWSSEVAVDVVMTAPGYPEAPVTGGVIKGVEAVPEDVLVFHAGTALRDGRLVVAGGRVLNMVGLGPDRVAARARAYEAAERVHWPGVGYRRDIGLT